MARTVIGMFDDRAAAEAAMRSLEEAGFLRKDLSILARDERDTETPAIGPVHDLGADREAGRDAAIGGMAGLVAGVVALAIPGLGPLIAAGPLAGALAGLGIGAAAGGLIGVLKDHGVSEDEAAYYAEGVRRGGALVLVAATDENGSRAASVLEENGAIEIRKRADEWRAAGWRPELRTNRAG